MSNVKTPWQKFLKDFSHQHPNYKYKTKLHNASINYKLYKDNELTYEQAVGKEKKKIGYIDIVTGYKSIYIGDEVIRSIDKKYGLNSITLNYSFNHFVNSSNNTLTFNIVHTGLSSELIDQLIDLSLTQKGFTLSVTPGQWLHINQNTASKIKKQLKMNGLEVIEENTSVGLLYTTIKNSKYDYIKIHKPSVHKPKYALSGAFFPYYHNLPIDLSELQIYTKHTEYLENCLIYALKLSNLIEPKIMDDIILKYHGFYIRNTNIPEIAKIANVLIVVNKYQDDNEKIYKTFYGDKNNKIIIQLGFESDHYFLIKDIMITKYALNNLEEAKKLSPHRWFELSDKYIHYKGKKLNSLQLIHNLVKHKDKFLTEIKLNDLYYTQFANYDKNINYDLPEISEKLDYRYEINQKSNTPVIETKIGTFDYETDVSESMHKPLMVHARIGDLKESFDVIKNKPDEYNVIFSDKLVYWMTEFMLKNKCNLNMYAHNLKYDLNFIIRSLSRFEMSLTEKDSTIYQYCFTIPSPFSIKEPRVDYKLKLIDSYKMLPMKLEDMPKSILNNMNFNKEIFPYKLLTQETMSKGVLINDIINYKEWKDPDDSHLMLKNCHELGLINNDKVNIYEYCNHYCKRDVDILYESLIIFNKYAEYNLDINTFESITGSSLAHKYCIKNNSYVNVQILNGIANHFIREFCRGGKVALRESKSFEINEQLDDTDAVSLYPSAIYRLSNEYGGILNGYPKLIKGIPNFNSYDGYFVEFKIKKIGKRRKFPLISFKDKSGNVEWRDDDSVIGREILLDRTGHEDFIKYHQGELEFIRGYYYDQGRNKTLGDNVFKLFNLRLQAKKDGNVCMDQLIKILLNSIYGKLYEKEHTDKVEIFNNLTDFNKHITNKQNFMIESEILYNPHMNGDKFEHKPIYKIKYKNDIIKTESGHAPHIACEILSMSKRIMNEVMCLAEDNGLSIYYQDTDSMHVLRKDSEPLKELFFKKYNRELIGKNMGQFASDFKDPENKLINSTLISSKAIFLGKKCYVDVLEGNLKSNPNIKGVSYHFRMKGIPQDTLIYYSKVNNISIYEIYKKLLSGESITFDLTNNLTRACFDFNKSSYTIHNRHNFMRTIKFA